MAKICKDGFSFSFDSSFCDSCGGRCCTGESGYIWLNAEDLERFCAGLSLAPTEFIERFCIRVQRRISLAETPYQDGFACVFFDPIKKQCSAYDLRPSQCRSFPFWSHFKRDFAALSSECPGVSKEDKDV